MLSLRLVEVAGVGVDGNIQRDSCRKASSWVAADRLVSLWADLELKDR